MRGSRGYRTWRATVSSTSISTRIAAEGVDGDLFISLGLAGHNYLWEGTILTHT